MADPLIVPVDMAEPIATPPALWQQTRDQQAQAPYHGLGFRKDQLEPALHEQLVEQYHACAARFQAEEPIDYIQTNEPKVIPALYFEDKVFNTSILQALKPAHEAWSGMVLEESACYGFRVYQRGSYLYNHVDRTQTHIISATICVDYRLDKAWPLYIEDAAGQPFQVDMKPGELVFYEGARLVHGRPWPLVGDYYVGMFVHYRPIHADPSLTVYQ